MNPENINSNPGPNQGSNQEPVKDPNNQSFQKIKKPFFKRKSVLITLITALIAIPIAGFLIWYFFIQAAATVTYPTLTIGTEAPVVNPNLCATDPNGVSKVEFYANGNLIGEDTDPNHTTCDSYSYNWATLSVENGLYAITAKIVSNTGEITGPVDIGSVNIYSMTLGVNDNNMGQVEYNEYLRFEPNPLPNNSTQHFAETFRVPLFARPSSGYHLDHWEGDCAGNGSNNWPTVTMDGNKSCTAIFAQDVTPPPPPPPGNVSVPTFNPPAGTYATAQSVTITSSNATTIKYTTDGSVPAAGCTDGTTYASPISVTSTTTINARACASGLTESTASATYTISSTPPPSSTVATPTFNPIAGSYSATQNVTISTTTDATIKYTTNGADPAAGCTNGITYSNPVSISSTSTIKARACKSGMTDSDIASALYTISTSGGNNGNSNNNTTNNGSTNNGSNTAAGTQNGSTNLSESGPEFVSVALNLLAASILGLAVMFVVKKVKKN